MLMSDSSASDQWWRDRLVELHQKGFETQKIEHALVLDSENASELLDDYERLVTLCESLKEDIELLPANLEIERRVLFDSLKNVEKAPEVERQLLALMAAHRPWRLTSKRSRSLWKSAGLEKVLDAILVRLDALDPSMYSHAHDLLDLLEQPEKASQLKEMTLDIEQRQSERGAAQANMASMLKEQGFEVEGMDEMNLAERFERLQELQELEVIHSQLERRILRDIGRFDSETAANLNAQRKLLTVSRSEEELDALSDRISKMEFQYQERLDELNKQFNLWTREGFQLDVVLPLLADEMLIWEPRIEVISDSIIEYHEIWNRLQTQLLIWPDEYGLDSIVFGNLVESETISDLVDELEKRTGLIKNDIGAGVSIWEERGFELGDIAAQAEVNPRRAKSKLDSLIPILERAHEGLLRMEDLDTSLLDFRELESWKGHMTQELPDQDQVDGFEKWLDAVGRRESRHRSLLDAEWAKIQGNDRIGIVDTEQLNLKEYEELVLLGDQEGIDMESSTIEGVPITASVSGLMMRMRGNVAIWIETFKRDGWDVSGLENMMMDDYSQLIRELPTIRIHVEEHEKLFKRLERLEWGRDSVLATKILRELKKPERLPQISRKVPHLMKELATSSTEDKFVFRAWRPTSSPVYYNQIDGGSSISNVMKDGDISVESEVQLSMDDAGDRNEREEVLQDKEMIPKQDDESVKENALEGWEEYVQVLQGLLRTLGADSTCIDEGRSLSSLGRVRRNIAPEVGVTPRDIRVDRMLRIMLRCMPLRLPDDVELGGLVRILRELSESAKLLSRWTEQRLERRHASPDKGLLANSRILGAALMRIPSPSFAIPLGADDYEIPSIDNMDDFIAVAKQLHASIHLPNAGARGVTVPA